MAAATKMMIRRLSSIQSMATGAGQGLARTPGASAGRGGSLLGFAVADGFAHAGVGLDVFHLVVVHDAETAGAESLGHGEGDLGLGLDDLGLHLLHAGDHFLFEGDGGGAADFGLGLGDALVGLGLGFLELGADVLADVHVGDVDGEDFKGGADVEAALEHDLGNGVGRLEHDLVGLGRADGGDDALADAGDDGLLLGAADEAVEVGAHGHASLYLHLDAVLGHAVDGVAAGGGVGAVDDLGIDGGAHGLDDALAGALGGEVDGAGAVP